jgi:hypothetical protein
MEFSLKYIAAVAVYKSMRKFILSLTALASLTMASGAMAGQFEGTDIFEHFRVYEQNGADAGSIDADGVGGWRFYAPNGADAGYMDKDGTIYGPNGAEVGRIEGQ